MAPKMATTDVHHPIAFEDGSPGKFRAPLMPGSEIPAILGGRSLNEHNALIDCRSNTIFFIGLGGYKLECSPGTEKHQMHELPGGHWMLPCTAYDRIIRGSMSTPCKIHIEGDYFKQNAEDSREPSQANAGKVKGMVSQFEARKPKKQETSRAVPTAAGLPNSE